MPANSPIPVLPPVGDRGREWHWLTHDGEYTIARFIFGVWWSCGATESYTPEHVGKMGFTYGQPALTPDEIERALVRVKP